MKLLVSLLVAIISLVAFVDAQGSSDPSCLTACTPLSSISSKCGYDLLDRNPPPLSEKAQLCMCREKGFVADFQSCLKCMNTIGYISDADFQVGSLAQATCDDVKGSGAGSIIYGGSGYLLPAAIVAVGVGIMA